jgi:hypothetical protein
MDPCLVTAGCPVTGVEEGAPAASTCEAETRRIFGVTGVDTGVFLGPPDLMARDGFGGTGILTRGKGGGISVTGVGGGR